MKLVCFSKDGAVRVGVLVDEGHIVDLPAANPELPNDMSALVGLGSDGLRKASAAVQSATDKIPLSSVRLRAPFPRPRRNVFCVGKNYYDHAHEFQDSGFDSSSGGDSVPELPIIFTKTTTSVSGPGDEIPAHLDPTHSVDYEGELTVVIGKGGRGIKKAQAFEHVYGYTIINDVTSRERQKNHKQWFLGKSLDGFCPMGPWLVTADEMKDITASTLETRVNGEVRQNTKVAQLIFDIPTLIETISAGITLEPGDLIATGTPKGVGIGFTPPKFLKKGDVVSITITGLGTLENPVS